VSFASQLAGYGVLGNVGGSGNTGEQYWGYYSASGGGGGATTPGGTPTDYSTGGTGGEGLASDITGTLRVYGSGGGGGTISGNLGGAGGTGAGSGNIDTGNGGSGQDALANQGGGGGGGGRSGNGGKGGSGIVVLRFHVPGMAPALPQVAGEDVEPAEVFTKAREAKSIVYPSEPTVTGDVGSQVVSFGGVDVNDAAIGVAQVVHQGGIRLRGLDGQGQAVGLDGLDLRVGGCAVVDLEQMVEALLDSGGVHVAAGGELHAVT
jgi:hypothetical protein